MKILLPVDCTEPESFIQEARRWANRWNAQLLLLHARPPSAAGTAGIEPLPLVGATLSYTAYDPAMEDHLRKAEEDAFHDFLTRNFEEPVQAAMRAGDPADCILEDAEEEDVDMILMGKNPKGTIERLMTGSTAQSVVKKAERPVVLIPIREDEAN